MVKKIRRRIIQEDGPDPTDVAVGRRIKSRRLAASISQEQLGHALGLTFQQVQKYESGKNRVSASKLVQIAKTLNCEVSSLFTDENAALPPAERANAAKIAPLINSRESLRVAEAFNMIEDHDVRQAVIRLLETLANLTPGEAVSARAASRAVFGARK